MKRVLYFFMILLVATSCDKLDLPMKKNQKYNGKALDPNTNMTAWEFMNSRQDLFSNMIAAIEKVDEDLDEDDPTRIKPYYTEIDNNKRYTFLLLNNIAFSATDLNNINSEVRKENCRNVLRFHIIQGEYNGYENLNFTPIFVVTLWNDPRAIMSIKVAFGITANRGSYERIEAQDQCGASTARGSISSNYKFKNGWGHIFQNKLQYRADLSSTTAPAL